MEKAMFLASAIKIYLLCICLASARSQLSWRICLVLCALIGMELSAISEELAYVLDNVFFD